MVSLPLRRLSEADAQRIINDFDENGDGELSVKEFINAWEKISGAVLENEAFTNDLYDRRIAPYKDRIQSIFDKLDEDKSGELTSDEMKEVVTCFQGETFDWDEFLGWYDTHAGEDGGPSNGAISIVEFGWYIADCAYCDEDKMLSTIDTFEETVDYVLTKGRLSKAG